MKIVTVKDRLSPYNVVDTDDDALNDWNEVDSKSPLIEYDEFGNPIFPKMMKIMGAVTSMKFPEFLYLVFPSLRLFISEVEIVPCISNPADPDSDGDGLLDGKSIYVERVNSSGQIEKLKAAPKDPTPYDYTGPFMLWKIHIQSVKSGKKVSTEYSDDYYKIKEFEEGDDKLTTIKNGLTVFVSFLSWIGSAGCDVRYDYEHIALHSDTTQWQMIGGYNYLYDIIFEIATSMDYRKLPFSYKGTNYVIWAWKGNYLKLGPGAEVGFYYQNEMLQSAPSILEHWIVGDNLPMTVSLYKNYGSGFGAYFNWMPTMEQWWITGFVPESISDFVLDKDVTQIASVDFSKYDGMLEAIASKFPDNSEFIFDKEEHTLWLAW